MRGRTPSASIARGPATRAVLTEAAGLVEVPRLLWRFPSLLRVPRGDGGTVLVLPGRGVDDASTLPLRGYLRLVGHDPRGWALGANDGDFRRLVPAVIEALEVLADAEGRPIPLVGQSMGGAIARAVAVRRPDLVRRIVTLGSPTMAAGRGAVRCPVTVVYSESDQIVPPRWALDPGSDAEVVEVSSTHFSMGIDPDVWELVARRLVA